MNRIANCSVWEAAVSGSEGTLSFDPGPHPSMGHLAAPSRDTFAVPAVMLDRLVSSGKLSPPDLIKCDIEGAEYDALTGAADTLARHRPTLFLFTHTPEVHRKCCDFLCGLRYRLQSLDSLPLDRTTGVLAIREDAAPGAPPSNRGH